LNLYRSSFKPAGLNYDWLMPRNVLFGCLCHLSIRICFLNFDHWCHLMSTSEIDPNHIMMASGSKGDKWYPQRVVCLNILFITLLVIISHVHKKMGVVNNEYTFWIILSPPTCFMNKCWLLSWIYFFYHTTELLTTPSHWVTPKWKIHIPHWPMKSMNNHLFFHIPT